MLLLESYQQLNLGQPPVSASTSLKSTLALQQRAANSADLITDIGFQNSNGAWWGCTIRGAVTGAGAIAPWLAGEKPPTVRIVRQDLRMQLGLPLSLAPQMQFELLSSWLRTASMRVVTSFDTSLDVTDHNFYHSVLFKGKAHTYILLLKDGGKQGHSAEASYSVTGIKKSLRLKIHCVLSPAASGEEADTSECLQGAQSAYSESSYQEHSSFMAVSLCQSWEILPTWPMWLFNFNFAISWNVM